MLDMGILDPTKVTRLALQNAASVAGLLLTTEVMVAEAPKDDDHKHGGMPDMSGMGGMRHGHVIASRPSGGEEDARDVSHGHLRLGATSAASPGTTAPFHHQRLRSLACWARDAPIAVLTCLRSSGGGSTAFIPNDWIQSSRHHPWEW